MQDPLDRTVLLDAYAAYGRPRDRWLVGAEFERHLLHRDTGRPMPFFGRPGVQDLLQRFIAEGWVPSREGPHPIAAVKDGASITLEPGAQFELSGRPYAQVSGVHAEAEAFVRAVDRHLEGSGFAQVALGYTPYARIEDIAWVPKGRYAVMREHLARTGDLGHHMMKGTAATQASFDFDREGDVAAKARVGIVLAPLVTAMFANSPLLRGRPSGHMSLRGLTWTRTDPARCGFPTAAAAFSFERWVDYLLDVPMMFVKRGGTWHHAKGRTFRDWMEHGGEHGHPTWDDWDLHLTSVFPEVRIKRQIEVRMADCVPLDLAMAFVALFKGLFYCPAALHEALALCARFDRFDTKEARLLVACKDGLQGVVGGRPLAAWAEELVGVARAGISRCDPDDLPWLAPLERVVASGKSPARHLLDALARVEAHGGRIHPSAVIDRTHPLG